MSNCGGWRRSAGGRAASVYRVATSAALALIVIGAGACGRGLFSGSSAGSSSGGGGGSATARSVYVTNFADGKLTALANSSGTLTSPSTIAAGLAAGPLGLALTPPGAFAPIALYAANLADNTIHEFGVSATGNLSALATIAAGTQPQQIAVTPNGVFAYAINLGGSLTEYLINSASGQLSANSPSSITTGLTTPVSAAASNAFLYVTDPSGGAGLVLTYAIGSAGTLSLASSVATGGSNPGQIAIDTITGGSTWVFVADATSGVVAVFQVVGSALSLVATIGTPVGPAGGITFATTSAGLAFLFVANPTLGSVASFSFNTVTGIPAALPTTPGFSTPIGLAVDNPVAATTLFVTNNGTGTVATLGIAATTGALTVNSTSPFATESPLNGSSKPAYVAVIP